jgi:hypothetical protein
LDLVQGSWQQQGSAGWPDQLLLTHAPATCAAMQIGDEPTKEQLSEFVWATLKGGKVGARATLPGAASRGARCLLLQAGASSLHACQLFSTCLDT